MSLKDPLDGLVNLRAYERGKIMVTIKFSLLATPAVERTLNRASTR